jgi:hypothetical protein
MSLIQQLTELSMQDLKRSDASDAGSSDVVDKGARSDIAFSMMRNNINSDGEVTGSDVADYLERAAELNDEVDTVPFGIETDDGDIVKVYVNADQADKFEEEMKKLLGMEDDIEECINRLAQKFDIVDVVWPKDKTDTNAASADELDLEAGSFDPLDDLDDVDAGKMREVARFDPLEEALESGITKAEINAYKKIVLIKSNLEIQGSAGVAAATGLDRAKMTKFEMIKAYLNDKYKTECELARSYFAKQSKPEPAWLKA